MMRLLVLFLCLAAAGGIAGYTHYARDTSESTPVFTVPQRALEPAKRMPPATAAVIEPGDRAALARALQRELKRVGCYDGDITGVWTTSSRMAMKAFTDRVNATLPIDTPDPVLLSLVRGHGERACGVACPAGQTAAEGGACVPDAVVAKTAKPSERDGAPDAPDKGSAAVPAAAAAAALALTAPAAGARPDAKAADSTRPAAITPAPQKIPAPDKKAVGERTASHGGPVPPEAVRERRPRRQSAAPRPPKVVRDIMRALGFK